MSYDKSDAVAAEILLRIRTITTAGGFNTDIGAKAFDGRQKLSDVQEDCCTVIEGDDDPLEQREVRSSVLLPFLIVGQSKCDLDNPYAKARAMAADIKRAIFHDGNDLGGKVKEVKYLGRSIAPRGDGADFVTVGVEIEVHYVELLA